MRKAALLYNPLAGTGQERRRAVIAAVEGVLRSAGIETVMEPTHGPAEAGDQARHFAERGYDTIFACGGDGTINDVLQGIVGTWGTLGVIPLGTGNTLAHDLRLPLNAVKAAWAALSSKPCRFPVGRVEYMDFSGQQAARYFTVAVGVGVDAHMFYRLNVGHKTRLGMAAYYAKATHLWVTDPLELFDVEFEDAHTRKRNSCAVSEVLAVRIRNFGGILREFAPGASLDRNHLRLVLFKTRSRLRYLQFIARGLVGGSWWTPGIELADAQTAKCTAPKSGRSKRIFVEADGELIGTVPAEMSIMPDAFTMLVPETA
jgi:diacylglycerol kinase (ATP)